MKTIDEFKKKAIIKKYGKVISSQRIETYGASGGNCWGGEAVEFDTGNSFQGISHLSKTIEDILKDIYPEISFKKYKKLIDILEYYVEEISDSYNEYYGNYSHGFRAELDIDNFFKALEKIE